MTEQTDTPAITTYPEMDAKIVALLRLMPDEASLTALYAAQRIEELEARIRELEGLLHEARVYLSNGFNLYDLFSDALALPSATEEGVTTDGNNGD